MFSGFGNAHFSYKSMSHFQATIRKTSSRCFGLISRNKKRHPVRAGCRCFVGLEFALW
jgi:hypothetical protein